jgi:hypothetical protein
VPSLADVQGGVRRALVSGGSSGLEAILVGGRDPARRLAIHQRHYRVTLVSSLVSRFPATGWLVGSGFVAAAADAFVSTHPPSRPCIAEYGDTFPAFLGRRPSTQSIPYLEQFAALEWHVARASLAVEHRSLAAGDFQVIGADALAAASLSLQPGVHYLPVDWAIDELFSAYLADQAPEQFVLARGPLGLEVRGRRGDFAIHRLDLGELTFRSALTSGVSIGAAIDQATAVAPAFDAMRALVSLIASGLVTQVHAATSAAGDVHE